MFPDITGPVHLLAEGEDGEVEPATPLPQFVEDWISVFSGWTAEHKMIALNGLISV